MPNPHTGGPPLVSCLRLLIQYIRNYPPYWRTFLHLQPEDAPCNCDRDPLIMGTDSLLHYISHNENTLCVCARAHTRVNVCVYGRGWVGGDFLFCSRTSPLPLHSPTLPTILLLPVLVNYDRRLTLAITCSELCSVVLSYIREF